MVPSIDNSNINSNSNTTSNTNNTMAPCDSKNYDGMPTPTSAIQAAINQARAAQAGGHAAPAKLQYQDQATAVLATATATATLHVAKATNTIRLDFPKVPTAAAPTAAAFEKKNSGTSSSSSSSSNRSDILKLLARAKAQDAAKITSSKTKTSPSVPGGSSRGSATATLPTLGTSSASAAITKNFLKSLKSSAPRASTTPKTLLSDSTHTPTTTSTHSDMTSTRTPLSGTSSASGGSTSILLKSLKLKKKSSSTGNFLDLPGSPSTPTVFAARRRRRSRRRVRRNTSIASTGSCSSIGSSSKSLERSPGSPAAKRSSSRSDLLLLSNNARRGSTKSLNGLNMNMTMNENDSAASHTTKASTTSLNIMSAGQALIAAKTMQNDDCIHSRPVTSTQQNNWKKMGVFCSDKLLQNRRRLVNDGTLYGRDSEIKQLEDEFQRVVGTDGGRSLCLIQGLSGDGKTALAMHLGKRIEAKNDNAANVNHRKRVLFVTGKFNCNVAHQQHKSIGADPYSGIKAAIRELCVEIHALPKRRRMTATAAARVVTPSATQKQTFEDLQEALENELDWELEFLSTIIPELALLTNNSNKAVKSNGDDDGVLAQKRRGSAVQSNRRLSIMTRKNSMGSVTKGSPPITSSGQPQAQAGTTMTLMEQTAVEARAASDRLNFAFRRLINVVSNFAPICLVLDDVQFADSASIKLLQGWFTDIQNPALMLIWTYRSNMVPPDHIVSKAIQEIEDTTEADIDISVCRIQVGTLKEADVDDLLADLLGATTNPTQELANLICRKTFGNAFFTFQYLLSLAQKGLLTYQLSNLEWNWDVTAVRAALQATDTVVDLMKDKLRQSPAARMILPLAACLGSTFEVCTLENVMQAIRSSEKGSDAEMIFSSVLGNDAKEGLYTSCLSQIERQGLIEASGENAYTFIHDKVIEEALALIPEDKLALMKYHIGCILFTRFQALEEQRTDQIMFLAVNLLSARLDLIPEDQRQAAFELYLSAADAAYVAAAHHRSTTYYAAAIKLLPVNHWESMHETSLYVFNAAAEAEMCLGNYQLMEAYTQEIKMLDVPILEKVDAYRIEMDALISESELPRAWEIGLDVLKQSGFYLPKSAILPRTIARLACIKICPKKWKPEALAKLPISLDPMDNEISRMYSRQIPLALMANKDMVPITIIVAAQHVLDKGITRHSAVCLAWLGMLTTSVLGDLKGGAKLLEFVYSLLEQYPNPSIESRIAAIFNCFVCHWTTPIHKCAKLYIDNYSRGMETCDMDSAFWCAHFYHEACLYSGTNLALLEKDSAVYSKQMEDYGMIKHLECLQPVRQLILNLRGESTNSVVLTGTAHDETAVFKMATSKGDIHLLSHVNKDRLFAAAFFGDWKLGAEIGSEKIEEMCQALISQHSTVVSRFLAGLCCFEMASNASSGVKQKKKRKYYKVAIYNLKVMEGWCSKGNPNAAHYAMFLTAEKARCKGKTEKALSFYQRTIVLAGRSGYNHDQALAYERLSSFYKDVLHDTKAAEQSLRDAVVLYKEWGALKKVDLINTQLELMAIGGTSS